MPKDSEDLILPRTRSYKKDDEPLLNLTGAKSRCSREKIFMCTQKKAQEVPSVNTGGFLCTRWTKQGIGGKC